MTVSQYDEKSARSINVEDLEILKAFGHRASEFDKIQSGFVTDATITVASVNGYVVGEIWWDSLTERWLLDTEKYGEQA